MPDKFSHYDAGTASSNQPAQKSGGVRVCEVHAAPTPLFDEADNLAFALEKLDELEE